MTDFRQRVRWPMLSQLRPAAPPEDTPEARAAAVIRAHRKAMGLEPVVEPEPGTDAAAVVRAYNEHAKANGR
jgi:hypothetical protein